jgi:SH3 domain protein
MQHTRFTRPHPVTLALIGVALLQSSMALAQTWYVVPSAEIPVRRGIGTEYKIIAIAPDGTEVELLSEQDGWAQIRLPEGKEGWLPKRYLHDTPPPYQQVTLLEEEKKVLLDETSSLQQQLDELTAINERTAGELSSCIARRDSINDQYETLQHDAATTMETKERLIEAEQQVATLEARLSELEQENRSLKKDGAMRWFLAGGGVLLVGWILGVLFSSRSSKRRSSLLS